MGVALTPGALGRVAIRETLGRGIRKAAAEADKWEQISELVSLRATRTDNLQPEDFKRAGERWGVDPAALHALADAESAGRGFDAKGRLVILVEPHIFSRATNHAFDVTHPWLSYPTWQRYRKGAAAPAKFAAHPYSLDADGRWDLFVQLAELSPEAACAACSAGRFQHLCWGYKALGFASAEALFRFLATSEERHLDVLHRYLEVNGLLPAFEKRDWRQIARGYNGGGQVELYATRMADNYSKRRRLYA